MQLDKFGFYAFACDCSLQLFSSGRVAAQEVAVAIEREAARIEAKYSRYRPESVLSRINIVANEGGSLTIDDETAGLVKYALMAFDKTGELFDVTSGLLRRVWDFKTPVLPCQSEINHLLSRIGLRKVRLQNATLIFESPGMELDFGGMGKEYAVDRATEICVDAGLQRGLIDFGGDIRVISPSSDSTPWQIGIRHPRDPATAIATLGLSSGAVATSGDYERYIEVGGQRYCHILNPITGWPTTDLSSASVVADTCLLAGTFSTVAMLKGTAASAWLQSLRLRHLIMDADGYLNGTDDFQFTRSR